MECRDAFAALAMIICATCFGRLANAACAKQALDDSTARLASSRQALLALPVSEGPDSTLVSPAAQKAIATMKEALAAFVDTYMQCAEADSTAEKIKDGLSRLGHVFQLQSGRTYALDELPKEASNYGFQLSFDAQRWKDHPTMIGVTATFQIQCGSDAMLMLFDSSNGAWHEILRWQAPRYRQISGAYGSFDYRVAPPDHKGAWYVLVKSVPPWCSSTWSSIGYSVLRPVPGAVTPRVVYSRREGMWWGGEDFGELVANATDFEVRFHNRSIDSGVHNRVWIEHFSIVNDAIDRTPPVAESPRDFVDAWIQENWHEASRWTATQIVHSARSLHERLHKKGYFDFVSVQRCLPEPDRTQVGIVDDDKDTQYFFRVDGTSAFVLTGVSNTPDANCAEPTLPAGP